MRPQETEQRWAFDVPPEAVLEAVVHASQDAVVMYQANDVVSWNRNAERLFGWTAEEVIGSAFVELFPAHVRDEVRAVIDAAMGGDAVSSFESEARRRDGMPMPVALSAWPVFDRQDAPVAVLVVARDITEQRLAQATLAEVESRVRESEALAQVGTWLWDVGSGAVQWSDECHRIHGVDPLSFAGTLAAHLESIHPDDREGVHSSMVRSVAANGGFEAEHRIVRPDATVCTVHTRAHPTVDSRHRVLALRGVVHEVPRRS